MKDSGSLMFSARLSRGNLAAICDDVADLLLGIDARGVVVDASTTLRLPQHTVASWIGRQAVSIAMPDSAEKFQRMLTTPPVTDAETPAWRHVNLRNSDGSFLPILARIYPLSGRGPIRTVIFGRDLSPMQDASDRFIRSQQDLVRHYEDHVRSISADCRRRIEASDVGTAAKKIGGTSVDQIVASFARRLRWHCAQEALTRHNGDCERAALDMGIADEALDIILADGPGD